MSSYQANEKPIPMISSVYSLLPGFELTYTIDDEIRQFQKNPELCTDKIISIGSVIDQATSGGRIVKVHRLALGGIIKAQLRDGKRIEKTYQNIHEFTNGKKVTEKIQVIVYYECEYQAIADIVLKYIADNSIEVIY